MKREEHYLQILDASAKFQYHVSEMLEAKATEAEKAKAWMLHHVHGSLFPDHRTLVKQTVDIHEQLIEVIDGLTKLENSFARNLKIILQRQDDSSDSFGGGFGGGFGGMFDMEEPDA